ncbi:hypothetical protein [Actinobacillus arthritidis]|uniref:hypothetical protein n=1 Tax=Actinobacillus arthritidis TaxID=157339 RepID=UPI00244206D1|nr:hypothetical protein [Actinobacillus arthritidis]WGE89408.1 hypothetical protein NYR89_10840 [Actinobacillus arthritidis]
MGGNTITNVGAPKADDDAATKKYVKDTRTLVTSNDIEVTRTDNGDTITFDLKVKPAQRQKWAGILRQMAQTQLRLLLMRM